MNLVDRVLDSRLGQIQDYEIAICLFSTKRVALRSNNKDWLARSRYIESCVYADCCFSMLTLYEFSSMSWFSIKLSFSANEEEFENTNGVIKSRKSKIVVVQRHSGQFCRL
jgi:hypothetical protein